MVPRRPPSGVPSARVSVPRPRIALTGALAVLATAAAVANRQGAGPSAPAAVAGLAVALCAAGFLRLEVRHRDGVERLELFGPVLLVAVFAMPSGLAVLAAALAAALLEGLRRVPPPNGAFTVARWSCAAGAGSLTFAALREGFSLAPRNLLALSAAMVAAAVAAGLPLWLAEHRGPWVARGSGSGGSRVGGSWLDGSRPGGSGVGERRGRGAPGSWPAVALGRALGLALDLSLGLLFVAAWEWTPLVMPLFLLPLGLVHWAASVYSAVRADQGRLAGMQRATHALSVAIDPREAMPEFLSEARRCFDAEVAVLLERDGWRTCLAAPVRLGGGVAGALAVYDPGSHEGFERNDLAVLQTLAVEAGAALEEGELLETILEERTKLSEIVEHASDGIAALDPDGTVTSWNPGFESITGYRADEVIGTRGLARLRPRDLAGQEVRLERWASAPEALPTILEVLNPTGERCWISCSYARVPDVGGPPRRLVLTSRDVTKELELQRAEQALRERAARFQAL